MHHFAYRDSVLHAEDVALPDIAAEVGTPFYCYSTATFTRHLRVMAEAFAGQQTLIAYAMKAASNQALLRLVAREGHGVDVVSLGELERALRAGIVPDRIIFSGVAKTEAELERAITVGIKSINVESEPELERLAAVAARLQKTAPVSVRVNPNVDARTHEKIATGKAENKFGIPFERARAVYRRIAELPHLEAVGVDMHIGSQITDLAPFDNAVALLISLVRDLKADGHDIHHIDIGGGLGIPYGGLDNPRGTNFLPPDPAAYAATVRPHFNDLDCELVLEPGRLIAGNAGILVTKIEYVKQGSERVFQICDAGMNDLLRPTLYNAEHEILPVTDRKAATVFGDLVGPVCETGDYIAKGRDLRQVTEGDLVAIMSAGAYGAVMAGTYNSRPLIPEVLVDGEKFHVIRPRETLDDLIGRDSVPHWLA